MSIPTSSLILCLLITLMPFARSSEASSSCASTRFVFLYDEVRVQCPICTETASPLEVTGESLDKELSVSGSYYSVLFYASWCPFSRNMQQIFDALSSMFPHIRHLAVEESSASPSFKLIYNARIIVFARYGVHSFPALILVQQTTRIWYHGPKDLYSLVQFYRENTGLELVSYFTFEKLHNSEKVAPLKPWNGSIKEMIGSEPYLAFALLFICMKTFIFFSPAISSCLKDFSVSIVWRSKLGIVGGWNHLFEQALDIVDIKKLHRKLRFCDKSKNLHKGAKSAQVLASSLASVSLGESLSSSRLAPCFQD